MNERGSTDGVEAVFYLIIVAVIIIATAWVYDWDWRCVIASCRILK